MNAFTLINRIVLLVNQELLLDGNVKRFLEKSTITIERLEVEERNLRYRVENLEGERLR